MSAIREDDALYNVMEAEEQEILISLRDELLPQLPDELRAVDVFMAPVLKSYKAAIQKNSPSLLEDIQGQFSMSRDIRNAIKQEGTPEDQEGMSGLRGEMIKNDISYAIGRSIAPVQQIFARVAKSLRAPLPRDAAALDNLGQMWLDHMTLHSAFIGLMSYVDRHFEHLPEDNRVVRLYVDGSRDPEAGEVSRNEAVHQLTLYTRLPTEVTERLFDWTVGVLKAVPTLFNGMNVKFDDRGFFEIRPEAPKPPGVDSRAYIKVWTKPAPIPA